MKVWSSSDVFFESGSVGRCGWDQKCTLTERFLFDVDGCLCVDRIDRETWVSEGTKHR